MPADSQAPDQLEIKPSPAMLVRTGGVIAAAAVLTLVLIYLLFGGGADLFAQRTTLTTYLPDATGVAPSSEVRLSGIVIGKVDKVEFSGLLDPQRAVRVGLRVSKRYLKNIPEDSQTDVDSDNIVGYAFIGITEGKSAVPVGEDGVLQSEPLKQAVDRADQIRVLRNNLAQIDDLLAQASSPDTQLGKFIVSDVEYNKILGNLEDAERTVHSVITPQSTLGQAFYSLDMYNKIHDGVTRIDASLHAIQNGQGLAGELLTQDDRYNDLVRQLSDLRATLAGMNAGQGSGGALLENDELYQRLEKMIASVNSSLASLNAGEGRAGELLASPQLYESLTGSLQKIEELLHDLRTDPKKYMRLKVF
ncbi:MAG TPA: MlaD family protein [Bryobacteraceae bacterium]|jgi:phospholipid/cholesterol/gamma-HCH transport system substrate-binding protein|nr:MlaD family protein [Bryobacteraceae bacterium]